jgi:hypothetical protein
MTKLANGRSPLRFKSIFVPLRIQPCVNHFVMFFLKKFQALLVGQRPVFSQARWLLEFGLRRRILNLDWSGSSLFLIRFGIFSKTVHLWHQQLHPPIVTLVDKTAWMLLVQGPLIIRWLICTAPPYAWSHLIPRHVDYSPLQEVTPWPL